MVEKGDVIEVRCVERKGAIVRDVWVQARVSGVTVSGLIGAKCLRGAFDDKGHDLKMLQRSDKGRTWR
jgi:hypothetical protein